MRSAERTGRNQSLVGRQQTGDRMDLVVSRASSREMEGSMVGILLASMVLPEPGGPIAISICQIVFDARD
jgi:hypothetical protein